MDGATASRDEPWGAAHGRRELTGRCDPPRWRGKTHDAASSHVRERSQRSLMRRSKRMTNIPRARAGETTGYAENAARRRPAAKPATNPVARPRTRAGLTLGEV